MKSTIKHTLLTLLVMVYLVLAVGHILKLDVKYLRECYSCRVGDAVVTKEDKRIMRYFGVNAMKILDKDRFVMYNDKWCRVVSGKYDGVKYSLVDCN